jgi:peptidoglycan/LPS O-acetylase OafA/YrhL
MRPLGNPPRPSTGNSLGNGIASNYRPEIDGLRALAVLAVILNHFNKDLLQGGYLGVDIFFVISGYVISGSILKQQASSAADFFLDFYARRIKRILPALAAMVLLTSLGIALFDPAPGNSLRTGMSALFGFSNISLYQASTSYFSVSTDLNPFTHTWSLGVEEQFYFVFPLLIWMTGVARSHRPHRAWFVGILLLGTIFSLAAFIFFSRINQPFAYFSMFTRFWEIGLGALVYLALRQQRLRAWLQRIPALPLLMLLCGLLFTDFRVKTTIAVVAITGLLLACLRNNGAAYRILTLPPMRYVGLISYSLYLWHWPVLSISRWTIGIHPWTVPLQVAAMTGLAILSFQLVESPVRHASWLSGSRRPFIFGLLTAAATALVPGALIAGGRPLFLGNSRLEQLQGNLSETQPLIPADCVWWMGGGPDFSTAAKTCTIQSRRGGIQQRFFLMGDSHTSALDDWLSRIPERHGLWARRAYAGGQSVPLVENRWEGPLAVRSKDAKTQQRLIDLTLSELHYGDVLLLVTYSLQQFRTEAQRESPGLTPGVSRWEAWWRDLERLVQKVEARGASVVILSPLPDFELKGGWDSFTGQNCTLQWYRRQLGPHCQMGKSRATTLVEIEPIASRLRELEKRHSHVHVFDPLPILCPPQQLQCINYSDGQRTYTDYSHLTRAGSILISDAFDAFLEDRDLFVTRPKGAALKGS